MPLPSRTGIRGLYLRDDGRYRIDLRYSHPRLGTKERYQELLPDGTTRAAAKQRALDVLNAALSGTLQTKAEVQREAKIPKTLGVAFDRYLEFCAVNAQKSDPKYKERHRDHWLKTLGAGFALDGLDARAIEKHKARRHGEGKGPGTINRELVTIKHFLRLAAEWGWIERVPKIALLAEPPPRVRWLTDKERAALAKGLASPQREAFRRVVSAALLSGQRLGKLIELQKTDVDLKARQLTIRNMRKGGKVVTKHQPISPALASVLKEAMAASKRDHVFVSGRHGKAYTRSGVSTFFARVVEESGIKDFTFHDLRHTFATETRRAGHGLDVVQALLGHASPAMTLRYAHLGQAELQAAAGAVVPLAPVADVRSRARSASRRGSRVASRLPHAAKATGQKRTKTAMSSDGRRAS